MGNSFIRGKVPIPSSSIHQYNTVGLDYGAHATALTTRNAPWNITQWIDPFDPDPKATTAHLVLVVRKR